MRRQTTLIAATAFAAALVGGAPPPPAFPSPPVSQWVWTQADADIHREVNTQLPVRAGVFVATIEAAGKDIRLKRALSPTVTSTKAIVVRFDDSLHKSWSQHEPSVIAHRIEHLLTTLLADVDATGAQIDEVQLDYDAPVRRLPAWAQVVDHLASTVVAGRALWLTSIPAHVRTSGYGALFTGSIDGHILQLFDTGLGCDAATGASLAKDLALHGLPYRIGLGAFERGDRTEHGCWFRHWPRAAGFEGLWIFPAGNHYRRLLP